MGNKSSFHQKKDSSHDSVAERVRAAQKLYVETRLKNTDEEGADSDAEDVVDSGDEVFSQNKDNSEATEDKAVAPDDRKIRLPQRNRQWSVLNKVEQKAKTVDPSEYVFPFENIVLEGGGNKGLAYCGAVQVLEELGIWPQVRRIAGASAGAMTAALLCVGYNSKDIEEFLSQDLSRVFLDHSCGYFSLLPNLLRGYGWNPGEKIYHWFGDRMKEQTGNADVTFKEIYDKFHKELCVIVTNLNQMTTEYCHPKTSPDMPVRLAVRMSMAIPGMFRATQYTRYGQTDTFVDGGVLCNYPIHAFDGWWLSMKPADCFLKRLQPLSELTRLYERNERFGTYNDKTLGFLLYADNERDLLRYNLEGRFGVQIQELPNTKLARKKLKAKSLKAKTEREHRRVVHAVDAFLKVLEKHNTNEDATINREELLNALADEADFPKEMRMRLFGDVDDELILQYLDKDQNGQICFNELVRFMEETGIHLQSRFLGYERRDVKNFFTFLDTLQSTLLTNVKKIYVEERDFDRTVGINTGHVGTSDFTLEKEDRTFIIDQGRKSTLTFLKYFVANNNCAKKPVSETAGRSKEGDVKTIEESELEGNAMDTSDIQLADMSTEEKQPFISKDSKTD